MTSAKEACHGMAVAAYFVDRDSCRLAHAGHPEQVPGTGHSGADKLPERV